MNYNLFRPVPECWTRMNLVFLRYLKILVIIKIDIYAHFYFLYYRYTAIGLKTVAFLGEEAFTYCK